MTALSLVSVAFDKGTDPYTKGDTITLTVEYTSNDYAAGVSASEVTDVLTQIAFTDVNGTVNFNSGQLEEYIFNVDTPAIDASPDPMLSIGVTDSGDHTWTQVSNTLDSFDTETDISTWTAVFTTSA